MTQPPRHQHLRMRIERGAPSSAAAWEAIPSRVNRRLAVWVTRGVSTMYCAYLFLALALVSAPAAFTSHNLVTIVAWISQTFLQLVMLPVITVGQSVLSQAADDRAKATYDDATALLAGQDRIDTHLAAVDDTIAALRVQLARLSTPDDAKDPPP